MQQPVTSFGLSLRRIFFLLQMLEWELEWAAMDEQISPERRKRLNRYKDKFIGWVRLDLLTSNPDPKARAEIYQHITSEHSKNLSLWMDMGLECGNLEEVMNMLRQCEVKQKS